MAGQPVGPRCYRHPDRETYIACQRCGRPICPDCMRDAAVGFQCPECVSQGAKQTRQGRLAFGGQRSANPQATSIGLIAINLGVWIAVMLTGASGSKLLDYLMLRGVGICSAGSNSWFPQVDSEQICALTGSGTWYAGVSDGAPWQLITAAFTHVEVWHIGFNMLALWFLGPQLEAILGRARFLALYLIAALGGSALVYLVANPQTATLGASGAIFGLMAATLVVAHRVGGDYQTILGWVAANFVLTFMISGISWQGHLGGFLIGGLVAGILVYAPRRNRARVQWIGLAAIAVVLIAVIIARTLALA